MGIGGSGRIRRRASRSRDSNLTNSCGHLDDGLRGEGRSRNDLAEFRDDARL
jgi:hypothetical protein